MDLKHACFYWGAKNCPALEPRLSIVVSTMVSTVILDLSTAVTTVVSTLYDFHTTSILCMVLTMHVLIEL